MTLTPEQIKEAVRLADGFSIDDPGESGVLTWFDVRDDDGLLIMAVSDESIDKHFIAALASQLISQVDAIIPDYGVCTFTDEAIVECRPAHICVSGPNRDENSILACCEFLREKGNE